MKPWRLLIGILLIGMIGLTLSANEVQKDKKESKKDKKDGTAPSAINPIGQPTYKQGKNSLYALWYQDGLWHLRTTSAEKEVFTGTIRIEGGRLAGGNFQGLDRAKKGKNADWVILHPDGKGFDFRFVTFSQTDGINFRGSNAAEAISFNLLIGGGEFPKQVLIGGKRQHPTKVPFSLPAHPKE